MGSFLWHILAQEAPGITATDHVEIGGSRYVAQRLSTAIGGDNVKWVVGADGSNGADRALLEAIDPRRVARRYDELVIMSGDHAFADLAHHANGLGLQVHVVTTRRGDGSSSLSR